MSAGRKRSVRAKLLALLVSSTLGLLGVELVARVAITERPPLAGTPLALKAFHEQLDAPNTQHERDLTIYALDRELGFRNVAGIDTTCTFPEAPGGVYRLRTNALALRDERPLEKKAGKRVLVLGDSMTFGIGVEREEAFPAALERKLGGGVEVVNAGCCMWGQWEEQAFLAHRGAALAPDVVVLEFTVANDVLDDLRYSEKDGLLVADPTQGDDLKGHPIFHVPLLAEHSRAYRALVWKIGRHVVRYRAMKEPWRLEHAWDLIERTRALATKLGARFALVIAPTAAQLERSFAEKLLHTHAINEFILERAAKDGVPACDPTAALEAVYARGRSPYFAVDQHWNKDGHEAVATALAPLVAELLR